MNAPKPPSLYSRAETLSRRAILAVGAGVFAWGLGSIASGGLLARLAPRVEGLPAPLLAVLAILIQELWVLALIPALAFLLTRIGFDGVFAFATTGAVSGTVVRLALDSVVGGLDALVAQPVTQAARALCLLAGLFASWRVANRALVARRATEAQAQAAADADRAQLQAALGVNPLAATPNPTAPTSESQPPEAPNKSPPGSV